MMASSEDSTMADRRRCASTARRASVTSRKIRTTPETCPLVVPDRGGAVVNRPFGAVLGDEDRVIRQPDDPAFPQRSGCGVLDRAAGSAR